jgi:hypothetical protein
MHTNKNNRQMSVSNKQNMLVQSLEHFFTQKPNHKKHMSDFLELVQKGAQISLRVIDWFVTNYSREHDIIISNPSESNPTSSTAFINVHESYKQQLKAYSKRQFDPFCRRKRINFHYEENQNGQKKIMKIKTTVGQLNFFKWAIENNIIQYVRENIKDIEESMRAYVRQQREEKRKVHSQSLPNGEKTKTRRRNNNDASKDGDDNESVDGNTQTQPTKNFITNHKTLRKGTIVTNRTHTTVFFS